MGILSSEEIGWLAGIIDGEGSINLGYAHLERNQAIRPVICIGNTDIRIVKKIKDILDKLNIKYWIYPDSSNYRNVIHYRFCIESRSSIIKILLLIKPYLAKARETEILLEFSNRKKGTRYTENEKKLNIEIRELHHKFQNYKGGGNFGRTRLIQ